MVTIEKTILVNASGQATLTLPPSVKPGAHRAVLHVDEAPLGGQVPAPGGMPEGLLDVAGL